MHLWGAKSPASNDSHVCYLLLATPIVYFGLCIEFYLRYVGITAICTRILCCWLWWAFLPGDPISEALLGDPSFAKAVAQENKRGSIY